MRYRRSSIARFIITILLTFIFIISQNYILLPFATLQARAQDVHRYKSHDTTKLIAQTANNQKPEVKEGAVSGSFVDYFAEERQLKGHEGSVNSANFSPDGKRIVTAGSDRIARVWDESGKEVAVLRGHSSTVRSANFSPDGKLIVTASFDGTALLWNLSGNLETA
jgi:WD40 repeat protein